MTEIAEYLSYRGLDVHVICVNSTYNKGEELSPLKEEEHQGVHIHRVFVPDIDKNNLLKRFLRLLVSSTRMFLKIRSSVKDGDKLLVVTNPAFLILMMPYIVKKKSVDYTILVHDVFPENLVAIKKLSSTSLFYKCLKMLFDKAYSKADCCISIGRDMSEVLSRKISGRRICMIPIWAENLAVFPKDKEKTALWRELSLSGKFVFQFAGNLGRAQGIDNLLNAISRIVDSDIHFLFIGGGAKYDEIERFAREHKNVSLIGFQDRSRQNDFLNACDVGIVTLSEGMYGLGVPSKSYNIMASGRPILYVGEATSEIALCVKEYGMGWVVEPDNPQKLAEKMEEIYRSRDLLDSMKGNARKVAETVFAKNVLLEKYYALLS